MRGEREPGIARRGFPRGSSDDGSSRVKSLTAGRRSRVQVLGDGSDCNVADVYILQRHANGEPVSVQNVCKAYFGL